MYAHVQKFFISTFFLGSDRETSNGSSFSSGIIKNPDGSVLFIPDVPAEVKPLIGTFFKNYDAAVDYYNEYAKKAGFSVRRSTIKFNKKTINRYVLCNKAGLPRKRVSVNTMNPPADNSMNPSEGNSTNPPVKQRRRSNFKVINCKARICLKGIRGSESFTLVKFIEGHNHPMLDDSDKHLSRGNRQLQVGDKEFIFKVSTSNFGATQAHRIHSLVKGGSSNLNGTVVDYKNFRRDLNKYVGDRDAQMLVEKLEARKAFCPNFSFEYEVVDSELTSIFWADEISKFHYQNFSDVLCFDATYDTNL